MRKDALKKLLAEHDHLQAQVLSKLLENAYSELTDDQDIPFNDVVSSLQQNGFATDLTKEMVKDLNDIDLFYLFITGTTTSEKNILDDMPRLVSDEILPPLLDVKSIVNLSACSSSFYSKTQGIFYWKDKLIAAGCNQGQLEKVIHADVIRNYKKLYRSLLCFEYVFRNIIWAWELYCLSGEPTAIQYAVQQEQLTHNTKGWHGLNALHHAALSGSIEAIRYAIETLKIPANSKADKGANALHYAARSGSVEAMRYLIETLNIAANSTDTNGINALHYAAYGGSVEAMKYAIETLKIPANSTANRGGNALHYAALSGSVEAVRFVRQLSYENDLKLEPTLRDFDEHDAFWYAKESSSAAAIKDALNLPIEEIVGQPLNAKNQKLK